MYSKLIVSSLESRAIRGDIKAIAELRRRADLGMKRARLALERIAANEPTIIPVNNAQLLSYPLDPAGQDSWEDLQRSKSNTHDLVSTIEREEFEKYGNLTAQQIFDKQR